MFDSLKPVPNCFYYLDRMNEINCLLQNNFMMIADLQNRITNLIDLNSKIGQELTKGKPDIKRPITMQQRPSQQKIISRLFTKTEFSYCLLLKNTFKPLLYKDRNFNLFVGLYDMQRNLVVNDKSIPLKLSVYTSNEDSELIDANKQNQPIIKGNSMVDLTQGHAAFQKISIREVSSKFDRGVVNIIVSVREPPFEQDSGLDFRDIRPLVIKDVMIRAKKQV